MSFIAYFDRQRGFIFVRIDFYFFKKQPAERILHNSVTVQKPNSFYKQDPAAAVQTWKSMYYSFLVFFYQNIRIIRSIIFT